MPLQEPTTDAEIEQVSTLLWHIGANVEMQYGLDVSTALNLMASEFLKTNARFNRGTRYVERIDYSWEEWKDMVRQMLKGRYAQGYPIVYNGSGNNGGHMFIIDGYGPDDYFHVNWGWGGYLDGNFLLTAMDLDEWSFNEGVGMVYDAVPQTIADKDVVDIRVRDLELNDNVSTENDFSIGLRVINTGSLASAYCFGMGVFDEAGNFVKAIHTLDCVVELPNDYFATYDLPCYLEKALASTDQIAPIYKVNPSDTEWIRMVSAPNAPLYISGDGVVVTDPDAPAAPKVALTANLTGLGLSPAIDEITEGKTYEGKLIVKDTNNDKLPKTIRVTKAANGETWADYDYNPVLGTVIIRNVTEALIITAEAVKLESYSISYQLTSMQAENTPSEDKVKEGHALTLKLVPEANFRLPHSIQILEDGEALSAEEYTYDAVTGEVVVFAVNGDIKIIASGINESSYEVILNLKGLTTNLGETSFPAGSDVQFNLKANEGYNLPSEITVVMGETTLVNGSDYVYEASTGSFTLSRIIGAITITAEATPKSYAVESTITHLSYDTETKTEVSHGDSFDARLVPDEGYELPTSITVKMNGNLLEAYAYYYDPKTGEIRIDAVTGEVEIVAEGQPIYWAVTARLSHVTSDLIADIKIAYGDNLTVQFTAEENYKLPESITVKMGGKELTDEYTYENGVLTIPSVKGDVEITVIGETYALITENEQEIQEGFSIIDVNTNGDVCLKLNEVTNEQMNISSASNARIIVTNDSEIEKLINQGTTTLSSESGAQLTVGTMINSGVMVLAEGLQLTGEPAMIVNDGAFTDHTGIIRKVGGTAALELNTTPAATTSYTAGSTYTLTVNVNVAFNADKTVFVWQKKEGTNWVTKLTDDKSLRAAGVTALTSTYQLPANDQGTFRCVVTHTVSNSCYTVLMTETTVSVNTPAPDPTPSYSVTLPEVEGAQLVSLGLSEVEQGGNFSFKIVLQDGYVAENLVVKANGTMLLPDANGVYTITNINDNILITVTGVVKELPDANEAITTDATVVWTSKGKIHIHLGKEAMVTVTDFAGRLVRSLRGTVGDHVVTVPDGQYVIVVEDKAYKVVL